jgi:hypothetical protein
VCLCIPPNILKNKRSIGEKRNAYRVPEEEPEENNSFGKPGRRQWIILIWILGK